MTRVQRWGLSLPLDGVPLAAHEPVLRTAEAVGYTDAWSQEVAGVDPFTPLALAASWTRRMRLGTAIAGVFTRGPAITAMHAAGMAEAAPGRFVLGLGAASQPIVEHWNGDAFERPLTRVREVVEAVRSALAGEKVSYDGETVQMQGFRLARPVPAPVPIYVAALRERMLRLAGAVGDGVIINWLSAGDVPKVVAAVREGARATGKDPAAIDVVCRIPVCVTEDRERARHLARRAIAGTLTVPTYRRFQEWLGRGPALAAMQEAWAAGDRKGALAAIPDAVVDDLWVIGPPDECARGVQAFCAAGVTTPVLAFISPQEDWAAKGADVASVVERVLPPATTRTVQTRGG